MPGPDQETLRLLRVLPGRLLRLAERQSQAMHRPLARLAEQLGLVELMDDGGDGIVVRVRWTERGRRVCQAAASAAAETVR